MIKTIAGIALMSPSIFIGVLAIFVGRQNELSFYDSIPSYALGIVFGAMFLWGYDILENTNRRNNP